MRKELHAPDGRIVWLVESPLSQGCFHCAFEHDSWHDHCAPINSIANEDCDVGYIYLDTSDRKRIKQFIADRVARKLLGDG